MNVGNILPAGDTTASRGTRETGQSSMNKDFSDIFKNQMKDYRSNSKQEAHQKGSSQPERPDNDQYRTQESKNHQKYSDVDKNENKPVEDGKEVRDEKKADQKKDKTVDNKENEKTEAAENVKEEVKAEEIEEISENQTVISDYIKELQMILEVLKEKNLLTEEEAQNLSVELSKATNMQDMMKLLSNLLSKLESTTQLSQEDKNLILEAINLSNLSSEFKEKLVSTIEQFNKEKSVDKNDDADESLVKTEAAENTNKTATTNSKEKIDAIDKEVNQEKTTIANIDNTKDAKTQAEKSVGIQAEKKGISEQSSFDGSNTTNSEDGNILENLAHIGDKNMVTAKASLNQQPNAIDPKNVMDQVLQKVELLVRDGKSEIKMQLSPENLGKLSIKVSVEQGTVMAKVYAESIQVKEIIETNLNVLKDALSEKGISVSSLEVQVGQDQEQLLQERSNFQQNGKRKKVNSVMNNPVMVDYDTKNQYSNPYLTMSNFDGLA